MQSFTELCTKFHTISCRKIATVNITIVLNRYLIIKVFSTKLHAHQIFRWRELRNNFQGRAKKYLQTPDLMCYHPVLRLTARRHRATLCAVLTQPMQDIFWSHGRYLPCCSRCRFWAFAALHKSSNRK